MTCTASLAPREEREAVLVDAIERQEPMDLARASSRRSCDLSR